jgi:hypothetical protein
MFYVRVTMPFSEYLTSLWILGIAGTVVVGVLIVANV